MRNKLIVFDWNGTLLSDTNASLRATNACLEVYDRAPITMAELRAAFNFPILHFYKNLGMCVDTVLEKQDEANTVFQAAYEREAKHARTRSGTRALLHWIKDEGARSIILSNGLDRHIKGHLKRLNLTNLFTHISANHCDGNTILHTTTKHQRLEDYMIEHGYAPEDVVIIGDSTEEPALAKALGITCISITGGIISTARLRHANPDHLIHNLGDIRDIL